MTTKAENHLHSQLRQMGCCVCRFVYRVDLDYGNVEEYTAIHHITENNKRLGESYVLPMCPKHHQHGTKQHPSIHANGSVGGKFEFKQVHGVDEYDLLERCEEYQGRPYSTELAA